MTHAELAQQLALQKGDSDDWALVRMVELRQAGENARFRVCWCDQGVRRRYWLVVVRASGVVESPPRPQMDGCVEEVQVPPWDPL